MLTVGQWSLTQGLLQDMDMPTLFTIHSQALKAAERHTTTCRHILSRIAGVEMLKGGKKWIQKLKF